MRKSLSFSLILQVSSGMWITPRSLSWFFLHQSLAKDLARGGTNLNPMSLQKSKKPKNTEAGREAQRHGQSLPGSGQSTNRDNYTCHTNATFQIIHEVVLKQAYQDPGRGLNYSCGTVLTLPWALWIWVTCLLIILRASVFMSYSLFQSFKYLSKWLALST